MNDNQDNTETNQPGETRGNQPPDSHGANFHNSPPGESDTSATPDEPNRPEGYPPMNNGGYPGGGDTRQSPGDEDRKLNLKEGLSETFRDPIIIILLFIWFALLGLRIFGEVTIRRQMQTAPTDFRFSRYVGKMLYLSFYIRENPEIAASPSYRQLISELDRAFLRELEEHPDDSEVRYRYIFYLAGTDREAEAQQFFDQHREQHFRDEGLNRIFTEVYQTPDDVTISRERAEVLESAVRTQLHNWYRDITLVTLYEKSDQQQNAQILIQESRGIAARFIGVLAILILVWGTGLILGLPLSILIGYILFKSKNTDSLDAQNVRTANNPLFSSFTLKKGLMIFFVWELLREFISLSQFLIMMFMGDAFRNIVLNNMGIVIFAFQTFIYIVVIIAAVVIIRKNGHFDKNAIGLDFSRTGKLLRNFLLGIGSYLGAIFAIIVTVVIFQAITRYTPRSENPVFEIIRNADSPMNIVFLFLVVGILGPIFEELLFRGFLYTSIRRYTPAWSSILITSVLFSAVHFDPGAFFQLFILGSILALLREYTRSLVPSIIVHVLWNSMTFLIFITIFG